MTAITVHQKAGGSAQASPAFEPMYSIPKAAAITGVKPYALRLAIKNGLVPAYSFVSRRSLVRLSDIEAAVAANRR